jgi:hypothetical protein
MKRLLPVMLLTLGIVLSVWATADPPLPDTPEPPVRLKKKKKVEAEPEKPDKVEAKPEAPPDRPRKPKLDEDELDPRDDVKMPRNEEPDENEILKRITRNTRLSEEKLGNREVGESTRQIQDEIIKDLDRLLEQSNQNNQNQQNQQNQQDQQDQQQNQGGGQPKDGSSAEQRQRQDQHRQARERRERRLSRSRQQTAKRSQGSGDGQQPQQQPGGQGNNPGGGGSTGARGKDTSDRRFDLWGHLPEKERALMNKEMEQKFMEKYDELTKQYYRTIAEKSRKK